MLSYAIENVFFPKSQQFNSLLLLTDLCCGLDELVYWCGGASKNSPITAFGLEKQPGSFIYAIKINQ